MPARLGVEIIGDATSLKAALGSAAAATEKFAAGYKAEFAGMTDSTLRLALAEDKLAAANAKYGVGSRGAADATLAYRRQVDAIRESHLRTAQSIGRGLTTYVTAPTALLGFEAVKMGVEFQKQMLMIQTQAGASASEVKNLSGQVLALSGSVGKSPVELAQGLFHLESLGLRGSHAMRALRESAIAAGMGVANLEDVTTALGGAVVTGIRGTGDYSKTMGQLVAIAGAGNMRMEDLTAALGTGVLPAAKNAGVSLQEVGAALAVLTDRGMSAENAGTRLRMTFALLQAPSGAAKKALKDLGIDADAMAATLRQPNGLLKVLQMLHDAQKRVGATRGSRDILQAFGGGRSGAGILTLVQSLDSAVSSYQSKLEVVDQGTKRFGQNQKAYMESASFKLHKDLAEAAADLTKLGESLAPIAVDIARVGKAFGDAFSALPGPVKRDLGIVIGMLALGGPLILAGTGAIRMIHSIGAAFRVLPVAAGPAVAATDAEVASIGATALVARSRVGLLRASLLGLAGLTVAVTILEYRKQIDNAVSDFLPGFLGGGHNEIHSMADYNALPSALKKKLAEKGVTAAKVANELGAPSLGRYVSTPSITGGEGQHGALRKQHFPGRSTPRTTGGGTRHGTSLQGQLNLAAYQLAQAGLTAGTSDDRAALEREAAITRAQIAQAKTLKDKTALTQHLAGILDQVRSIDEQIATAHEKAAKAAKKHADAFARLGGAIQAIPHDMRKASDGADQVMRKMTAEQFVAGLGLSGAQKVAVEQKFAQVQAHGGFPVSGRAANGIHIENLHLPGVKDSKQFIQELQRRQKSGSRQTRGRHGGNALAF